MLNKIKILLGLNDDSKDDLLTTLIELCEGEACEYCGIDSADGMDSVIIQMVVYKYNRLGTEGLSGESYSGASYSYTDYPANITSLLENRKKSRKLEVF